jgi:hypothetical protein
MKATVGLCLVALASYASYANAHTQGIIYHPRFHE